MLKVITRYLALITAILVISGAANAAIISVVPSDQNVLLGQTFGITISGSDFSSGTVGGGLTVNWNPAVLNFVSINLTFPGDKTFQGITTGNLSTGLLSFYVGNLNDVNTGSFNIASLTFAGSGLGTSAVDLGAYVGQPWYDGSFSLINPQPTLVDGSVQVNAVPIPAAAWLLGSGLVGLVAIRRRMRK
jgi:hypothetical protein